MKAAANLLYQLALRDFRQRYVGSILGWLWGIVHPLVLLAIYTLLFRHAFGARLPAEELTQNYPLFLLTGLLPWLFLSESLTRSVTSLPEHAALIKTSVFPSEAIPASILASTGLGHLLALGALILVTSLVAEPPGLALVLLPVWVGLLALLALGLAWIVAALQVYLRDTAQVLRIIVMAWFWATPIFLPEAFYQERLGLLLDWNPLRYVVRGYRGAILGGASVGLADLAVLSLFAVTSLMVGGLVFRRVRKGFPDAL